MIIDRTYFVGELNIPNTASPVIGEVVDIFIRKYETKLLTDLMGYQFYQEFKTGIAQSVPDQRWKDLRDGVVYPDYNGRNQRWNGLIQEDDGIKYSFIANYVYYWYMRDNFTQTAAMGEVKSKTENSEPANPGMKMESAWNEMSRAIMEFMWFMRSNRATYPTWNENYCNLRSLRPINTMNI